MSKSLGEIHWDYFLLLEDDLIELFKFVEPEQANFCTYSAQIAKLFLAVCSEVDVALKDLMRAHDESNPLLAKKLNIEYYRNFVKANYASEFEGSKVKFLRTELSIAPWAEWFDGDCDVSGLGWWSAYNKVKHHRAEHYAEANLGNLLHAFSALFVVIVCIYRTELLNGGPGEMHLTKITSFDDAGRVLDSNKQAEIKDETLVLNSAFYLS
ncbi:hypothetical protein [Atopobium fossor]|uniref:hypothetical protein n=1 Tax=Atopobium fossor TaxID=39487 RepID=UPI000417795E|nr:hypothetical protein [Atopobium fossor]